ncbi:serine/threonine-protein kinase Nek11 [Scleropages formosus]|uniref:serine/threonine-protein kinase Nek11 n=1 Tax=Scleropages formosus TaxID=113540 RepID=UPI00087883FA|nr:serine/threonine-protein kinase Nek11 [Scleropages formosus]
MPRFEELAAAPRVTSDPGRLLAKRYILRRKLGRGGFGTVFLVRDTKARDGEPLKVLKEIPVGDLKPDETVPATVEAQLLAQLRHPAILRFHTSFLERDAFCIITEYCEDGDLDCKIEELRQAGRTLPESQVVEWFIQLLLGVHYMHERRILHRDLKAKNVFVKKSVLKIGDFGVSRLLVGSCDLATTFIGTPHYMSPEVLTQQGYDTKCDIWSLGCILYEMCCLERAFGGRSFLSVVTSIVEGPTPSLPQPFAQELCSVVQRMLSKDPTSRPSAEELLKVRFLQDKMQDMRLKLCDGAVKEETVMSERHAAQIKKVHLETLRQRSEVQKMSPRERMRLRKLQAADDNARELKCLAEEKYAENCRRTRELRWQHFQRLSVDLLSGNAETAAPRTRPIAAQDSPSLGRPELLDGQEPERPSVSELTDSRIPEDAQTAEAYYNEEEEEGSLADEEPSDTLCGASGQDSDVEAMMKYMENILENTSSGCRMVLESNLQGPLGPPTVNYTMVETRVERMRQFVREKLGAEVFQRAYDYLKEARRRQESEAQVWVVLGGLVERPGDCFHVDQLLYYEEQLGGACGPHA